MQDLHNIWLLVILLIVPCLAMMAGGIIVIFAVPGYKLTSAVQHFGAGVVFGALALEMIPLIVSPSVHGWAHLGVGIGFVAGVGVMLLVGRVLPYYIGDLEAIGEDSNSEHSDTEVTKGKEYDGITEDLGRFDGMDEQTALLTSTENGTAFSKLKSYMKTIPFGLAIPVLIDGLIDGILVGIAYIAGHNAGIVMSTAISIEMCFLGMSVSIAFGKLKVPKILSLISSIIIPLGIPIGGAAGAIVLSHLEPGGLVFMAVISFGIAALMYLVADELLVEAHENEASDKWYVTVQFFVGFGVVLLMQELGVHASVH